MVWIAATSQRQHVVDEAADARRNDRGKAEGFVFVALVTLTVIAILDLFPPRSQG
jgi:hypothetical protein